MVKARIVAVATLGQAKVGALAAVPRDDVADDHRAAVAGVAHHGLVLRLGAEGRVDLAGDAVEVAVHGGRVLAPADAAGPLHGASVHAADADLAEDAPELGIAQALEHRLARPRDLRGRVRGEPHRGQRGGGARLRRRVGMLPELAPAGIAARGLLRLVEHRALHQPADVGLAGDVVRSGRGRRHDRRGGVGLDVRRGLAPRAQQAEQRSQGEQDAA